MICYNTLVVKQWGRPWGKTSGNRYFPDASPAKPSPVPTTCLRPAMQPFRACLYEPGCSYGEHLGYLETFRQTCQRDLAYVPLHILCFETTLFIKLSSFAIIQIHQHLVTMVLHFLFLAELSCGACLTYEG